MCVIMSFDSKEKANLELLQKGERANPHGGGIAWINKKENIVEYAKGLTSEEIDKLIKDEGIEQPYVVHFRVDSVGSKSKELTHPFVIDENNPMALTSMRGKAKAVLFHNGHWTEWKNMFLSEIITNKLRLSDHGEWSDSRVMAMMASLHGLEILDLIGDNDKIAVLTIDGVKYFGSGWSRENGVMFSNLIFNIFDNKQVYNMSAISSYNSVQKQITENSEKLKKLSNELKTAPNGKRRKIKQKLERLEREILKLKNKKEDIYQESDIVLDDFDWYEKEQSKQNYYLNNNFWR